MQSNLIATVVDGDEKCYYVSVVTFFATHACIPPCTVKAGLLHVSLVPVGTRNQVNCASTHRVLIIKCVLQCPHATVCSQLACFHAVPLGWLYVCMVHVWAL